MAETRIRANRKRGFSAPSNAEDGVAQMIEKYALKGE
jgi:hypothetical protein